MDRRAKLLVVDDDTDLAQGLSVRLRSKGFDVLIAQDGLQALTAVRKEHPDLVLLDLGLPGGDGYTVLERLRNMVDGASIPVIVLSARDPVVNRDRAHAAGARMFFQKPASSKSLLAAIKTCLHQDGLPPRVAV